MEIIKYPKIQTIWKRESERPCRIIPGEYSRPEFETINRWHVTEKIDGMNVRVIWDGEKVEFRGRTDRAEMPKNLMGWPDANLPAEKMAEKFTSPAILFGEGYGAGIQKGGNYSPDQEFILFDVYIDGWWLEPENVNQIAGSLGIDSVPDFGAEWIGTEAAIDLVRSGLGSEVGSRVAEGIVCRSVPTLFNRYGERVMWKLKIKDYNQLDD